VGRIISRVTVSTVASVSWRECNAVVGLRRKWSSLN